MIIWRKIPTNYWYFKFLSIFVILTGSTRLNSATTTFRNSSLEGNSQHVTESEFNTQSDEMLNTFQSTILNEASAEGKSRDSIHPFMLIIYKQITRNENKKWPNMKDEETSIRGIPPTKVQQVKCDTILMEFNIRKNYNFMNVWNTALVLPITCIDKGCIYPKNFKMVIQTAATVLCKATLDAYPNHSYTVLDLTFCLHQWPYMKRFPPENAFNVTIFWKEDSLIHIGRPLLVLHFNTTSVINRNKDVVVSKFPELPGRFRRNVHSVFNSHSLPNRKKLPLQQPASCVLYEWHVTLQDLQWESRVIAPSEFNLNYCSGLCNFPFLGIFDHASSNAVIRSRLLAENPEMSSADIPEPHCVPVQLGHMDIMYLDKDEIIIEKLKNIVAEQCGCL